jgi:hypothetical protein
MARQVRIQFQSAHHVMPRDDRPESIIGGDKDRRMTGSGRPNSGRSQRADDGFKRFCFQRNERMAKLLPFSNYEYFYLVFACSSSFRRYLLRTRQSSNNHETGKTQRPQPTAPVGHEANWVLPAAQGIVPDGHALAETRNAGRQVDRTAAEEDGVR